MIRTVVCEKEGCSGSGFYIETLDNELIATCAECGSKKKFDVSYYDFIMISTCSECSNNRFKLFRDIDNNGIYAKCNKCGAPPEKIYVDPDGIQISYEAKLLHEVKQLMYQVDQRVYSVEMKIELIERGQEMLEESLAYINRYIAQQR